MTVQERGLSRLEHQQEVYLENITRPVPIGGCGGCHTSQTKFSSADHQICNFCWQIVLIFRILGTQEEILGAAV